jgi:hypothetical protein
MKWPAAILALALLGGCGRGHEHHPDWIIKSQVVFMSPDLRKERKAPAAEKMRLWFPYVSGDFYGPPTTGSFYNVTLQPDRTFELDLNQPHGNVVKSLSRTAFSMRSLAINPPEARIARLLPYVMQADGIEPLGESQWIDADTKRRLMLVYFDRKARIAGSHEGPQRTLIYDIWTEAPGYIWVTETDSGRTTEFARSSPKNVLLAVMPRVVR